MLVRRVTMQSCGEAPHGRIRATHACIEAYRLCIDYAARNRLIQVGNSPLAAALQRDMSLVHKDSAGLDGEMCGIQWLMCALHKDWSRLHQRRITRA